jgi:hypothetical protein
MVSLSVLENQNKNALFLKVIFITVLVLLIKAVVDYFGLAVLSVNSLTTAFFGGVFFIMGILFAGTLTDYKEAEKIPSDLVVSLRTLYNDIRTINQTHNKSIISKLKSHIKELLYTITSNFRSNDWKLINMDKAFSSINDDIALLAKKGSALAFLIKLRSELTAIDRLSHRIYAISKITFIPAVYTIAQVAIGAVLFLLVLTKNEWSYGGYGVIGVISLVLISIFLLIKDMDNPFEYKKGTYADVDLNVIFELEKSWRKSD